MRVKCKPRVRLALIKYNPGTGLAALWGIKSCWMLRHTWLEECAVTLQSRHLSLNTAFQLSGGSAVGSQRATMFSAYDAQASFL